MNENLKNLEKAIDREILSGLKIDKLSRNLFLYYGDIFSHFKTSFMADEIRIRQEGWPNLWEWLDLSPYLNGNESLRDDFRRALIEISTVQTASNVFSANEFQLVAHTIQIFLIIDFPTEGSFQLLKNCNEIIREEIQELGIGSAANVIGIFVLSRLVNDEELITNIEEFSDIYDEIKINFGQMFIVQHQNENNFMIKTEDEWVSALSTLLSYLAFRPCRMDLDDYNEWLLRRRPADFGFTAFSTLKFNLPSREIAEFVLVTQGAELLATAFFKTDEQFSDSIEKSMLAKIDGEAFFSAPEYFASNILQLAKEDLINPIASIDDAVLSSSRVEELVSQYELIIDNLELYFKYNKKVLSLFSKKLYQRFEYALSDAFDLVLNSYRGGAVIARNLASLLISNLKKQMSTSSVSQATTTEKEVLEGAFDRFKKEADSEPPYLASILRAIPFFIISVFFLLSLNHLEIKANRFFGLIHRLSLDKIKTIRIEHYHIWIGIVLVIAITLFVLIQKHAWRNRYTNALANLERTLYEYWEHTLFEFGKDLYFANLPDYFAYSKALQDDLLHLDSRLNHMFDYISNSYSPNINPENSFYKNLVRNRDELKFFSKFVQSDFLAKELKTIIKKRLLTLWRRIANEESGALSMLEWDLIEKAATRLLPYSKRLFQYSLCNYLSENHEKMNLVAEQLENAYLPFVLLDHNNILQTNDFAILEWNEKSCTNEQIVHKAKQSLEQVNCRVILDSALDDFSFSLIIFKENMQINSLKKMS